MAAFEARHMLSYHHGAALEHVAMQFFLADRTRTTRIPYSGNLVKENGSRALQRDASFEEANQCVQRQLAPWHSRRT